jgi:hypothetical protein
MNRILIPIASLFFALSSLASVGVSLQASEDVLIPAGSDKVKMTSIQLLQGAITEGYSACALRLAKSENDRIIKKGSEFEIVQIGKFTERDMSGKEIKTFFEEWLQQKLETTDDSVETVTKEIEAKYRIVLKSVRAVDVKLDVKSAKTGAKYQVECSIPMGDSKSTFGKNELLDLFKTFGKFVPVARPEEL